MELAKKTDASSASRNEAESSMEPSWMVSRFRKECTLRDVHILSKDADALDWLIWARKMALNCVATSKTLYMVKEKQIGEMLEDKYYRGRP
jgi:hypothetical protein